MGKVDKFREGRTCNLRSLRFSWDVFLRSTNKRAVVSYSDVVPVVHRQGESGKGREKRKESEWLI